MKVFILINWQLRTLLSNKVFQWYTKAVFSYIAYKSSFCFIGNTNGLCRHSQQLVSILVNSVIYNTNKGSFISKF